MIGLGTELATTRFMLGLYLTPQTSFITITQRSSNVASSCSFPIRPDDPSHSSSCLLGYCSTLKLAAPEMSAAGLDKDMFGND